MNDWIKNCGDHTRTIFGVDPATIISRDGIDAVLSAITVDTSSEDMHGSPIDNGSSAWNETCPECGRKITVAQHF